MKNMKRIATILMLSASLVLPTQKAFSGPSGDDARIYRLIVENGNYLVGLFDPHNGFTPATPQQREKFRLAVQGATALSSAGSAASAATGLSLGTVLGLGTLAVGTAVVVYLGFEFEPNETEQRAIESNPALQLIK